MEEDYLKINAKVNPTFNFLSSIQPFQNDKIIVTENENLASVFDLNSLSCIKNFIFTSVTPLTSPVIYDYDTNNFVAVKHYHYLDLFSNDNDLGENDKTTIKLNKSKKITCLLNTFKSSCLVLFQDGSLETLKNIINYNNSINNKNQFIEIKDNYQITKIVVLSKSNLDNELVLKFWIVFKLNETNNLLYELYLYDFKLDFLNKLQSIKMEKEYNSVLFEQNCLLTVSNSFLINNLNEKCEENLFKFTLNKDEVLIDVQNIYLNENKGINNIVFLCYNQEENLNYLYVYDSSFKLEDMTKKIDLSIQNRKDVLLILDSKIFILKENDFVYIPNLKTNFLLVDLIKCNSIKQEISEMSIQSILTIISENVKPIEKEFLLLSCFEKILNEIIKEGLNLKELKNLEQLFSFNFNFQFMIQHLKNKQFEEEFIFNVFDLLNRMFMDKNFQSLNLYDWINVFLDFYLISLNSLKNPKLKELFLNLRQNLEEKINLIHNVKDMKYLYSNLIFASDEKDKKKSKIVLPDKKHLGYVLDEIHL